MLKASRIALVGSLGWVFLAWLAVYLIDVQDFMGLRTLRMSPDGPRGIWSAIFSTHGPTELLQWFGLFGAAIAGAAVAGRIGSKFWLFLTIAIALVMLEDTLDLCNQVAHISLFFGPPTNNPPTALAELVAQLFDFAVISSFAAIAVLRYGLREWKESGGLAKGLILSGLTMYVLVAAYHVLPGVQNGIGHFINDVIAGGELNGKGYYFANYGPDAIVNIIADTIVEEAGELIGAGLLLAGALVRWEGLSSRKVV